MFHATSQTFNTSRLRPPYSTSGIALHRSLHPTTISHHHISKHNIFHITQSTSRTIPHPQLFHTTLAFTITVHFIPHHIISPHLTSVTTYCIFFPHLTSRNNRTEHCLCHILHHNSTPPHFTSHCNFRILHYATFHIPWHHIPPHAIFHIRCISVTFHITPCLKLQHSTSHFTSDHNSHQVAPPHLGTPFHIGPTSHFTPRHEHRIQIQITNYYPTADIPNHTTHPIPPPRCISTIISHHTVMSNTASHHSMSLCIPQSHQFHILHQHTTIFPMYHTIIPHRITTFHNTSAHCTTSHLASHHIAYILHRTLFHITRVNKAQHPTSGIAKHCTSHQIPHHAILQHAIS